MVRAKFTVQSIEGNRLVMNAVHDTSTPENQRFTTATPSGKLEMTIDNPPALAQFQSGKSYYVDFTPA